MDWDATNGRNRGAQQTVLGNLLEMERFKYEAGEEELGAVALVLDLAKAFGASASKWFGSGRRTSASQGRSFGWFAGILCTSAKRLIAAWDRCEEFL